MDLITASSPSPPPSRADSAAATRAVPASVAATAAAAAAAARRFLREDRRLGPDPGGRKRKASLTPPVCPTDGNRSSGGAELAMLGCGGHGKGSFRVQFDFNFWRRLERKCSNISMGLNR